MRSCIAGLAFVSIVVGPARSAPATGPADRGLVATDGALPGISVRFDYRLVEDVIVARVDYRRLTPLAQGCRLAVKLYRHRRNSPIAQGAVTELPECGVAEWRRPREFLPAGKYKLLVTLHDANHRKLAEQSVRGTLPDRPAWLGSKAGISDEVLPPWTPIESARDGKRLHVGVWGRTYSFESGPFPVQIRSRGADLLAQPIRVRARADGRPIEWPAEAPQVRSRSDSVVRLAWRGRDRDARLELSAEIALEYDGLLTIDWRITPLQPVKLDRLWLEIPFAAGAATHHNLQKGNPSHCVVSFAQAMGQYPNAYFCNEQRGLALIVETDRNWHPSAPDRAVEFSRQQSGAMVRLHLVDKPLDVRPNTMDGPTLSYTFGLMATPIKPVTRTYWDYRITIAPEYGYDYDLLSQSIDGRAVLDVYRELGARTLMLANWTDILCYNRPVGHDGDLRNLVREAHRRGMKVIVYFGYQVSPLAPEFPIVEPLIEVVPEEVNPDKYAPMDRHQQMHRVCLNGIWQDWLADGVARLIDEYDIDGVYLDTTACVRGEGCANRRHGCGYGRPDGTVAPTFPFFATARAMKRLYTIVKTRKPDGLVDMHNFQFPAVAWGTGVWNGEGLAYIKRGPFALDVLPLGRFRLAYMGHHLGVPFEFLCYNKPWTFEEAQAFCLLHDVPIRSLGGSWLRFNSKLWAVFQRFGRRHAEWLPYWKNSDFVKITPQGTDERPGAYVSLYRHDTNGVLAVVSNLGRESADVVVRFDLDRCGLSGKKVSALDALDDTPVEIDNGAVRFARMPSMGWKLLWIKNP